MNKAALAVTRYFRNLVAAQANTGIDFKKDKFYILPPEQLLSGQIDEGTCVRVFRDSNSDRDREAQDEERKGRKSALNVLLCAKTVKTVFEEYVKTQDEVDELTGIYFIPAVLHESGKLSFDSGENKLPWFPREFLQPMAESVLSVGRMEDADGFLSSQVDRIELIRSWSDYVAFFRSFYEAVSSARYDDPAIPNCSDGALPLALEANVYLFIDQTVHSTYYIMKLYNHLLKDRQPKPLYEHFISAQPAVLRPLIGNTGENKRRHSGQMGGEYPLSPSQREAINHFNHMLDGEILAVNGPPGTGKTTLLQSIVADLYVKRALEQRKPPLIVATSTNNQAVTNIIASFGSIKKIGIGNLEERWIEGVNSFAAYFPSSMRTREAAASGYQYTTVRGEYFVADIETAENLASSRRKLLESCGGYFGTAFSRLSDCQVRLHEELLFMEEEARLA